MEKAVVVATRRTVTGKQVGALRRQGKLPGVLYGHNFTATPILMERHAVSLKLATLTSSSLVTVVLDGKEHSALVREKQRNYITNELLHVDFQVVSLTEKIRANVSIELTGIAPAIKLFGGVMVTGMSQIEVESFPQDLPERILVDVSALANIADSIHVRDLNLSDKVTIHTDADDMIVTITGVAPEEEAGEMPSSSEPEVIEKGKKEEDED